MQLMRMVKKLILVWFKLGEAPYTALKRVAKFRGLRMLLKYLY